MVVDIVVRVVALVHSMLGFHRRLGYLDPFLHLLCLGSTGALVILTLFFTFILIITTMLLILIINLITLSWKYHLSNNHSYYNSNFSGCLGWYEPHRGKGNDLFVVRILVDATFGVNYGYIG